MVNLFLIAFIIFGYFEITNGNWDGAIVTYWALAIPFFIIYNVAKGIDGK